MSLTLLATLLAGMSPGLAACPTARAAPEIQVAFAKQARVRAGEAITVHWSSEIYAASSCRAPLFLIITTPARVRFAGEGFLAMPPGGKGPHDIAERIGDTRVFIPLHAMPARASGSFEVKFYTAGENGIDWLVVGLSDARGQAAKSATVITAAKAALVIAVESGKPAILVRDSLAPSIANDGTSIERPKKTIISNSNAFELQVFDKFYRVRDVGTGELLLERAGVNPNFSPSSRFIGAFAEGEGFEVIDLFADVVIVASAELNRHGGYEGTAHVAAWSRADAILALSFWGYGGVYVQQALVDGPGLGDGSASCHACQGIGVELSLSFDTGLLTWAGQERGWASLFESAGSKKALALAAAKFPGENDFENRGKYATQLAMQFLSQLGARYLFDAPAVWNALPTNVDDVRDGRAWRLGDGVMLSHACTQSADDRCSSLGIDSQKGQAELTRLVSRRIDHHGRRIETAAAVQVADARLIVARAVSGSTEATGSKNIWQRLSDLGVPVSVASRSEISTQSFDFESVFDKPSLVVEPMVRSLPALRQILVSNKELGLDAVAYVDEQHEITKIDPRRVRQLANWSMDGTQYWLTREDYQTGNSATPENQYLHILSGKRGGLRVVDLSTRLAVAGTLAKSTDQKQLPDHPWPSNVDMLTLVAKRYLLASGQWLHDRDRWGLVYDLKEDRTLFFDGHLPNGNATKSIAITDDGRVFMAANNNGQIYFWRIATGERILSGNYVDDELVVYDANGYFMATYEGAQFVFLKFPGLPGYLSFKQFAKTLARPDIVKALLAGNRAPTPPNLSPPPRLAFAARASIGHPGRLQVSFSVSSTRDLDKLRLFIDGQFWSERAIRGRDITIDEAIDIPPQARWLTAVAVDTSGSQSVPVARALPRDERASGRKLFVLAIGTDSYTRLPADLQLHYAVSDARNFLASVKSLSSGYYASVEAREFLDAPGLKTRLPHTLRELARAATQDDTIMLFVSGHGFRDPASKLYLLTGESEQGNIADTSLSWDDLARAFEGTRARIIVFIDACHSGAVPNGGSNDEIADALSARQVRFTVIAAAKGRQESFEKDELGGGVFTSAIVKALTGSLANLDSNDNGVIELTELYSKIKPAILSEMHGSQTPWIARADMVGEVPLF